MKKITLFLIVVIIGLPVVAQIEFGLTGLIPNDTCNFEINCERLFIDTINSSNNWQIGATNKPFFGQTQSLPNAIMTDTLNDYSSNNLSYFDLNFGAWDGSGFPYNIYIKFDHKYETDTLIDGGYITVSHDSGQTFRNILFDSTNIHWFNWPYINSDNMYDINDSLANGELGFSGSSDWTTTTIQWIWLIPLKSMRSDSLIVRFNFISDSIQTNKDGWMIDNIEIGEVDLGSSVEEFGADVNVSLYPNLTSDFFNYVVVGTEINEILITNIQGQTVLQKLTTKSKGRIDVSNLPAGNYFIRFSSGKKAKIKRLIIH